MTGMDGCARLKKEGKINQKVKEFYKQTMMKENEQG